MSRFDVYKLPEPNTLLVVDVQADLLSYLKTRVVIPLLPYSLHKNEVAKDLKPVFEIDTMLYILSTSDIATIETNRLKHKIGNLKAYHFEITTALDFLFQGF